jgi:hypothetical protein
MPTNRTPVSGRRRRHLTLAQRTSLILGATSAYQDAFGSDAERRAAWFRHRDYFLAMCRFGDRPAAFWDYEAPLAPPEDRAFKPAALYDAGLMEAAERNRVEKRWRARFEQSFEPHFGVCLGLDAKGQAVWLNGEEARQRHYRQHGIPAKLVRKWTRAKSKPAA